MPFFSDPNMDLGRWPQKRFTPFFLAMPILPGKSEAWLRFCQEMDGRRRDQHEDSRDRHRITRETIWLIHALRTDLAVLYIEADNGEALLRELAVSDHPFDRWYRQQLYHICGMDVRATTTGEPAVEVVYDWHKSGSRSQWKGITSGKPKKIDK